MTDKTLKVSYELVKGQIFGEEPKANEHEKLAGYDMAKQHFEFAIERFEPRKHESALTEEDKAELQRYYNYADDVLSEEFPEAALNIFSRIRARFAEHYNLNVEISPSSVPKRRRTQPSAP